MQVSKQREQLRCTEELVMEKETEVMRLQAGVEMMHSWLQRAQKARELVTDASRLYAEVDISVTQGLEVENRAQVEHPDLAARVQLGEEKGELLSTLRQLESAQTKLARILIQRTSRLQQELAAMESLSRFAKLDCEALTMNQEAVRNSLAAKSIFLYNIHSLPDEVLCQIFGLVVDEELQDRKNTMADTNNRVISLDIVDAPLRLGAVSHEWRRLVGSYPPVWRGIVVNFRGVVTNFGVLEAHLKEQRQLRQIEFYLSRSHGVDLDILIYVSAGTYEQSFLSSVASLLQPRLVRQIIIRAQHLSIQTSLDHEGNHPTLSRFLAPLPTARLINITLWNQTGEHGATDPAFCPSPNWLGGCKSFTCFGLHPLLPAHGAPSVQHLSITRGLSKSAWNLAATLSGFPNLTHLEVDPALKGHTSSLEMIAPPTPSTLKFLIHISTSVTGLDDLNKISNHLKLPSFRHLTLLNSPSSHLVAPTWKAFICGPYSNGLTVLEIIQATDPFMDIHQLTVLRTLKLHGSAVQVFLGTLASPHGELLPPILKHIYLYDSGASDQLVRKAIELVKRPKRLIQIHPIS